MKAGYAQELYVRSDTTGVTGTDKIDGILSADVTRSADYEETTDTKDGTGYKSRAQTLKDTSISMSGQFEAADTIQAILRTAYSSGADVYVTHYTDPSQSAGSKGFRYVMKVTNYKASTPVGGIGTFSCDLVGNGAPVAV
jgi:hypothetical protein